MKKLLRKLFLYLFKEDFQRMKALESSTSHNQIKILGTSPKKFGDFLWIFEFIHYLCCVNQLKQ